MAAGDTTLRNLRAQILAENVTRLRAVGCNTDGMLFTHPWSNFGVTQDLLANDSDKTFTVPTNHFWLVRWIMVNLLTTATGGNRELVINILDASANVIGRLPSFGLIAASLRMHIVWTGNQSISVDSSQEATVAGMPGTFILPAGFQLRVFDFAAIDAAADDMEVTIGRQEIDDT